MYQPRRAITLLDMLPRRAARVTAAPTACGVCFGSGKALDSRQTRSGSWVAVYSACTVCNGRGV